jgi:hypothetical protein
VRNLSVVDIASREIPKSERKKIPETLKDNSHGPNRVLGFWESRDKVACQRNSRNCEKEKYERWVLSINRRIRAT